MDKPTRLIEFETMLLGRHSLNAHLRRPDHLERSAYLVLSRLWIEGPMSIGELSEAFALDTSTVHRQTAAIRKAGLAERIPDPAGGVARKFRITAEGERRLRADRDYNVNALDRVLRSWSEEDLQTFATYLERFNTDLEAREARPWPRPSYTEPRG
ncbi:MarR family transcriptional regulator [Nocardia speluncae]|uniref:MarR family transcriptional regulator n=1 Tax=Nocardia speluncae TaxID=419477 RepID=A0A846XKV2_9NOCA|nr:MarR family transcriptional regulator [Nocardia speluncae]NKY36878.1 MarR family transcriptional regulator [Nocardia speluncae]